jgi:hypothetical protein
MSLALRSASCLGDLADLIASDGTHLVLPAQFLLQPGGDELPPA